LRSIVLHVIMPINISNGWVMLAGHVVSEVGLRLGDILESTVWHDMWRFAQLEAFDVPIDSLPIFALIPIADARRVEPGETFVLVEQSGEEEPIS